LANQSLFVPMNCLERLALEVGELFDPDLSRTAPPLSPIFPLMP
jgi:hypothetical protein